MEFRVSERAKRMRHCLMDDFHLRDARDMIFFNAGQPALDMYPMDLIRPIMEELLATEQSLLAYPGSQGDLELRRAVSDRMRRLGMGEAKPENILLTNGGTGCADILGQVFINEGDMVFTETPTFPETLDCFYKAGCRFEGVPMDEEGPLPDELERLAKEHRPLFFYVIPDFQNPTGRCTTLERRKAVIELARKYGFFIAEDDPYRELAFDAAPPPTYYSLAPDCTIYIGSFSKTIAPGVRTGWMVLPDCAVERAVTAQKATSLGYPALTQRLCARLLEHPAFDAHVDELRLDLRRRCRLLTECLAREMDRDRFSWEMPLGGMFLWCHLDESIDAWDFAMRARDEHRVAFFPGVCFTPNYTGEKHSVRFTFARQTDDDLKEGVRRIAATLRSFA